MSENQATRIRMTADEFSQLPQSQQPTELINGELIVSPSPIDLHQDIVVNFVMFLGRVMDNGKVVVAPMDVYIDHINVLQPDVFWLAENSQCINRDGYYYGAPELTIEVHSPATSSRDRREKFDTYEKHGVMEYWMVDPIGLHVEIWQRDGDRFKRLGIRKDNDDDAFESLALGKQVQFRGIFPSLD
jgi:Uma2 family endonuclease